jgi:UDP-3-O-[3-hydroxymyristoyl] glucosamine N-acyltransferase
VVLYPNVTILDETHIGKHTVIWPGAVILERNKIGQYCTLHSNVSIGADGFGFRPSEDGKGLVKIPQIGNVVIGNEVEIGANSTIDRARFSETRIGRGTKIDNLVQIGHNVRIGKGCLIVAQVGISGSATLEDYVVIGGQTGVAGHITIGSGVRIGGQSGISKSIPAGSAVQGSPSVDLRLYFKISALQRRLPDLFTRFKRLEESVRNSVES